MHVGRHYSLREVSAWTRRETAAFTLIAAIPTVLHALVGWTWVTVPWLPIALVGTAVAFITGFKNNASYSRLWEARQIWGAIVNSSRTFAIRILDFPERGAIEAGELAAAQTRILHRHIAWLTALRFQLRAPRKWENQELQHNAEYRRFFNVEELLGDLGERLSHTLSDGERATVMAASNRATRLIAEQSRDLKGLAERGVFSDYRLVELSRTLAEFYEQQGKCERIKNFPYPRQFATLNLYFVWLFIILVPLGLLQEFGKIGENYVWLTIPASVLVAWVFQRRE